MHSSIRHGDWIHVDRSRRREDVGATRLVGITITPRIRKRHRVLMRKGLRWAVMGLGWLIIAAGVVLVVLPLPLHAPGLLVIAAGLVIVLRNSFTARRHFIRAQRRHPKLVFPLRRLLRREPEVVPVLWQQTLRFELWIMPKRFRFCRRLRLVVMRRKRPKT